MCFAHHVSEGELQQFHRIPPVPQSTWGRWHRHWGHGTHTQGHQGGLQCHGSSHTPGRALGQAHTRQEQETRRGENIPRNPTSHPGAWFGTHSSCCWSLWGCAGQKAPSTPGAWLWGQSGFPGEHLLLSVFPPGTTVGVMLSASPEGCASTKGSCAEELSAPSSPRPAPRAASPPS